MFEGMFSTGYGLRMQTCMIPRKLGCMIDLIMPIM